MERSTRLADVFLLTGTSPMERLHRAIPIGLVAASLVSGCQAIDWVRAPADLRAAFAPTIPSGRSLLRDASLFAGGAPEQLVFRSQAEVDAFVTRRPLNILRSDDRNGEVASLPAIDFSQEVGILVIGEANANWTSLEITSVEDQGSRLLVHSVQWVDSSLLASSQPSNYVAIAKTDKPIEFAPLVSSYGRALGPSLPSASAAPLSTFIPPSSPSPSSTPMSEPTPTSSS